MLERRELGDAGCSFAASNPRFVQPDQGSLVLYGAAPTGKDALCLLRVPVDGAEPVPYVLRAPKGSRYRVDERTDAAVLGEDVVLQLQEEIKKKYIRMVGWAVRVSPDGDLQKLQKEAIAVAPSLAGPLVVYSAKDRRVLGVLDPETNKIVSQGQLKRVSKRVPNDHLTAGGNGLVAYWNKWEPERGVVVFDTDSMQPLGVAKVPKSVNFALQAIPTSSGAWIQGTNKKGEPKTVYAPFEGEPKTVDVCEGLAVEPCHTLLLPGPDDAAWIVAGTYDPGVRYFANPTLRRYDDPAVGPSVDVQGWDPLTAVSS